MNEHRVAFHVQDHAVVCSCGEYFRAEHVNFTWPDPIAAWAKHLREAAGINLADAYEAGWHDHFLEWQRQERDPSYPIGRGKRTNYPAPAAEHVDPTPPAPHPPLPRARNA